MRRGVKDSEALFVVAVGAMTPGSQIVESGRYLGRSTYLYGRAWPERRVVSIERDRNFEGADEALSLVRDLPNVSPLFADARAVLPELTLPGDLVVIDGPKDFRALRLAHRVLRKTKPAAICIHDVNAGTPIRAFMERHLPWAFYSDDPSWMELAGPLDRGRDFNKGGTYACIPWLPGYPRLWDVSRTWGK